MNSGVIRVRFDEQPVLKHGDSGKPYCSAKATLVVRGYSGKPDKEAMIYLKAFGPVADRLAAAKVGPLHLITFEYDVSEGYGQNAGKQYVDRIVRGVAQEIGPEPVQQHRQGDIGTSGMKRGAPPPQRDYPGAVQEDDLPF